MSTAFQSSAFQNNAFQIDAATAAAQLGGGRARRRYERLRGKVSPEEFRLAREIIARIEREDAGPDEVKRVISDVVEKEISKQVRRSRKPIFPQVSPVVEKMQAIVMPLMLTPGAPQLGQIVVNLDRHKREEEWILLLLTTLH